MKSTEARSPGWHLQPVLLLACSLALSLTMGCATTVTETMQVEVLDQWFVRVDGERMARDEFVFQIRGKCRSAKASGSQVPVMQLNWESPQTRRIGMDLMKELHLAGAKPTLPN